MIRKLRLVMPTLIALLVASVAGAQGGPAQTGGRNAMDPTERAAQLAERLGLTDEQRADVEAILTERHAAVQEARTEAAGDRGAMREFMRTHREETRAALADVLTDEQLAEWDALRDERRALLRDRRGGNRGGPRR